MNYVKTYLYIRCEKFFTKDDFAVIITCSTEKGWTGTLNPLDYLLQELVYEGRRERFADFKDLQNVIKDTLHNVDDETMRTAILQWKRRLAAVAKQNVEPILHIFC